MSFSHFRLCMDVLKELRSPSGVHPVVNDLRAGLSNLKRIANREPAVVKIDIDLVRNIQLHKRQQKLVRALVTLCGSAPRSWPRASRRRTSSGG